MMNKNEYTSTGKAYKWQRARTPVQQEKRRLDILQAAYKLFRSQDFEEISLNSIAEEAKLSKTSIYLYFKTREEIFMHIFEEAFREWITNSMKALDNLPEGSASQEIAATWIGVIWDNERMCSIAPLLQLTIEHNISEDILADKMRMKLEESKKLQKSMQRFIPGISLTETFTMILYALNLFSQFVANARNRRLLNVLSGDEFASLHIDLKQFTVNGVSRLLDSYMNQYIGINNK